MTDVKLIGRSVIFRDSSGEHTGVIHSEGYGEVFVLSLAYNVWLSLDDLGIDWWFPEWHNTEGVDAE